MDTITIYENKIIIIYKIIEETNIEYLLKIFREESTFSLIISRKGSRQLEDVEVKIIENGLETSQDTIQIDTLLNFAGVATQRVTPIEDDIFIKVYVKLVALMEQHKNEYDEYGIKYFLYILKSIDSIINLPFYT